MTRDLVHEAAAVIGVTALSLIAAFLFVFAVILAAWGLVLRRRDARQLEHVRPIRDHAQEEAFWAVAEQLLDDGLADVCEDLGWME